jgi:rhodanese-related sulfurtransferase
MIGQNARSGLIEQMQWNELDDAEGLKNLIVDVREAKELGAGTIPNSQHIPFSELRERWGALRRDQPLIVHCAGGQRSYFATRFLMQRGFNVKNLAGAYQTWRAGSLRRP